MYVSDARIHYFTHTLTQAYTPEQVEHKMNTFGILMLLGCAVLATVADFALSNTAQLSEFDTMDLGLSPTHPNAPLHPNALA